MKKFFQIAAIAILGLGTVQLNSGCVEVEDVSLVDNFVLEAFLFEGEEVDDVRVKTTFPISAENDESQGINDAEVYIEKNGTTYMLEPSGSEGYYFYAGTDLEVNTGDEFAITATSGTRMATAETSVPSPTTGVSIDTDSVFIPRVSGTSVGELLVLREALEGLLLTATWDNPDEGWYYLVVENIEPVADPLFPPEVEEALQAFRFVSDPTTGNSEIIIGAGLRSYGTHRVTVYHVNQEYADLFEDGVQDSRDLNEPPSNVDNALGIFTAFASGSTFFEVAEL